MPELPEVETVRRSLEKNIVGRKITGLKVLTPKVIGFENPGEWEQQLGGRKITGLTRRGKYLLIHLAGGPVLVLHLRMTGRLVYTEDGPPEKHTHVIFRLDNGRQLHFIDMRRFGKIILSPADKLDSVPGLKDLGVEPLEDEFTKTFFRKELRRRRAKIKSLLLDQTFIAGLGNIYADEALHRARIDPRLTAASLGPREVTALYHAIRDVLKEGIKHRGTTFRDYVDGDGRTGNYQELLRVYNRAGHPCPRCKTDISRIKLGGRSSYFCPRCQKPGK